MFFNHFPELIIVLIIALVVFGPKRLPELGSSLGKGIREFRKATNELQDSINVNHSEPLPPERPQYTASEYTAPRPTAERVTSTPSTPASAEYVATQHVENEAPRA